MPLNHISRYSDLTETQYAAVGKVVVEWANIEEILGTILARLLLTPDFLARTYTDCMSAARIQTAITEAINIQSIRYKNNLVSQELIDEITEINNKITSLRASRNKISHFCWGRYSDDEIFGTAFSGGVLTPKKENRDNAVFSSNDLAELHRNSHELVEKLLIIYAKLPKIDEETLLNIPHFRGE